MTDRTAAEAEAKIERLEKTIDLLEANARVQAKLLANTGRERDQLRTLPQPSGVREAVIEECAKVCENLRHDDYSCETSDWSGGTFDCARAIRALALSRPNRESGE